METGKNSNNSDVSSPENDHQPEKSNEDNAGVGRSYECTFCKRGFTNAQALGGHMNIHRKDKAKAKQKNQDEPSKKSKENYADSRYFPQISSTDHHHHHHHHNHQNQHQQQQSNYYRAVGGQVNYQVYLPSSNPNIVTGNYLPLWRAQNLDANLSLRIGVSPSVGDGERGDVNENEVDLELRLGHDP